MDDAAGVDVSADPPAYGLGDRDQSRRGVPGNRDRRRLMRNIGTVQEPIRKTDPSDNARRSPTIATTQAQQPDAAALLSLVENSLDDDKAQAVTVIELEGKATIADHLVIASGTSSRQVVSMADHLLEKLKSSGVRDATVEGLAQGDWVLIDAGDVIVHLFRPEVRSFYNLEKMWGVTMPEPQAVRA
jgi:ribosome-associated protein